MRRRNPKGALLLLHAAKHSRERSPAFLVSGQLVHVWTSSTPTIQRGGLCTKLASNGNLEYPVPGVYSGRSLPQSVCV